VMAVEAARSGQRGKSLGRRQVSVSIKIQCLDVEPTMPVCEDDSIPDRPQGDF
jgi:hypothetical protein